MSIQEINIGTVANDGTGDTLRAAMDKVNDNFALIQSDTVTLVAATWTQITYDTEFEDTDYQLSLPAYDSDGNPVAIRRRNKLATGVEVRAAVACDLEWTATKR